MLSTRRPFATQDLKSTPWKRRRGRLTASGRRRQARRAPARRPRRARQPASSSFSRATWPRAAAKISPSCAAVGSRWPRLGAPLARAPIASGMPRQCAAVLPRWWSGPQIATLIAQCGVALRLSVPASEIPKPSQNLLSTARHRFVAARSGMEHDAVGKHKPAMGIALGVISSGVLWATAWGGWRLFLYFLDIG